MACLDTCYYIGIGAILLIMLLFNVRCSFLQNGFHSLLRYDLRVDMFVNDNENESAETRREWGSLLAPQENESSESEKEVPSEPEATTSTKRDRSQSFAIPRPQEGSSDDDDGGNNCSGPGGGGSGPGGGGTGRSRRGSGPGGSIYSRRRGHAGKRNHLHKRNNIVFGRCDLDFDDDLQNSCVQLITNNLVELVNSESFLAQRDSVALMDDVLRLEKSLKYDKILGDLSP
ncbi:hypothetical protein V9T40_004897 [Parthenolecanium corni]|uniref:Uncharacterized protein n=1 Tax=Parthenolecanium corni TaxID=536013 RepID=A0AAN9TGV0_9HEMI